MRGLEARDAASRARATPSMTPMVDVVLVILVFFMASAALLGPEWMLGVLLPERGEEAGDAFSLPTPTFVLRIDADASGAVVTGLGLERSALEGLAARVRSLVSAVPAEELVIVLEPTDRVSYESVVRVREICEGAGASRVGLR